MNAHRFACLQEMRFASQEAKQRGISDLDWFFLLHAAQNNKSAYLSMVEKDYTIHRDQTLGSFYDALWEAGNLKGISLGVQKRDFKI